MKKKKVKSKFNISNKLAYTLIVVLSIVLMGMGVYAYNYPGPPSTMGHSAGELAPPTQCLADSLLTWNGTAWKCKTMGACAAGNVLTYTLSNAFSCVSNGPTSYNLNVAPYVGCGFFSCSDYSSYFTVQTSDVRAFKDGDYIHILGVLNFKGIYQSPGQSFNIVCFTVNGLPNDFPYISDFNFYFEYPSRVWGGTTIRTTTFARSDASSNNQFCINVDPQTSPITFDTNSQISGTGKSYSTFLDFWYPISPP